MRVKPVEAIKFFKVALERPDKAANHEVFWWLSKIFSEKNEVALSEDYYKLCQQAGGYNPQLGRGICYCVLLARRNHRC